MISKFFSKSKPVHYIVASIILLVVFVLARFKIFTGDVNAFVFLKQTGLFLISLFSVFVFDFFVTRNSLTKKNSYSIVLFVLFFAILPQTILNSQIIVANLFILLALRRLISLRTQKDIKKKLFDASFWIAISTLFYFWSSVFFILIFVTLITYAITDLKNYIIPLIGITTVGIMTTCYLIITEIQILDFAKGLFDYSLDYSALNSKQIIVGTTLLLSFGLWALFYYIKNIKSKMKTYRPSFKLIIITAILALVIVIFAPSKNGSEFIFLFAPLSIIITNYIEVISENWFKDTLLWVIFLTPIALLLL
nr:DUF6427 family protein [uncultured Psychroserpens sp.]